MRHIFVRFADFVRESDKILLTLCFLTSAYGCAAVFPPNIPDFTTIQMCCVLAAGLSVLAPHLSLLICL